MKIFLDIGAHTGETLQIVRDERWRFERIVSFEPAPRCWPSLRKLADARVEVAEFGLWKQDDTILLHNPGHVGASMSADKDVVEAMEPCQFRDAAAWFEENLATNDQVFVKINAEGAEADIIARLHEAGQLEKIDHLLIHFDVRKIPTLRHREAELTSQLTAAGVEWLSAESIQFGGVYRGTRNWLAWCHSGTKMRDFRYMKAARILQAGRNRLYPLKRQFRRRAATDSTPS